MACSIELWTYLESYESAEKIRFFFAQQTFRAHPENFWEKEVGKQKGNKSISKLSPFWAEREHRWDTSWDLSRGQSVQELGW